MIARFLSLIPALAATAAGAVSLELPVDCILGETCHIQQYMDHDPGSGARDFTCGPLSYDGHEGTDFGLPSLAAQDAGVDVLAAAAGRVTAVRDGMADTLQGGEGAPDITGRDCGNGLVIAHGDGWETQYCHMARGSLVVAPGDEVAAGTRLGQVGLSGNSEFPHLHLSVRQNGVPVDPFAPAAEGCGSDGPTLWAETPDYAPGGLLSAGFATDVPDYDAIRAGTADEPLDARAPVVFWGFLFGGRMGDVVEIVIDGPQGEVLRQEIVLERTQAQLFRATGLRAPPGGWPSGRYDGRVRLMREGAVIDSLPASATID